MIYQNAQHKKAVHFVYITPQFYRKSFFDK